MTTEPRRHLSMLRSYTAADAFTIPTSILIVFLLGVAVFLGRIDDRLWLGAFRLGPAWLHPLALVYGVSGSAMISATLRVPKP
jgi:CDP-diacylglycerol--serine O-phosphatidyltransferase